MLIHSYLTNGQILVEFAQLFLESLKRFDGEKHLVLFEGRNLSKKQISSIKSVYSNLEIVNRKIDYKNLSKRLNINTDKIYKMKKNCEIKEKNVGISGCVPWKQYISVEDRYRFTLKKGLEYCKNNNIEGMIHFDIDTCFYRSLNPIMDIIRKNDVTLQFRWQGKSGRLDKTKIVGGFLGFKPNENAFNFLDKWIEYIDKIKLKDKPKGYGQLSLYYTYKDMVSNIKIGKIPYYWSATKKIIDRRKDEELIILNASKGNKRQNLNEFKKVLKEKK